MSLAAKQELLALLERKLALRARDDLNAYCRYIDVPGAPINDDEDCEDTDQDVEILSLIAVPSDVKQHRDKKTQIQRKVEKLDIELKKAKGNLVPNTLLVVSSFVDFRKLYKIMAKLNLSLRKLITEHTE